MCQKEIARCNFARFLSWNLPVFRFLVFAIFFWFWQFATQVESAKQDKKIYEINNYDIRTDKSGDAQMSLRKFIGKSGKILADFRRKKKRAAGGGKIANKSALED